MNRVLNPSVRQGSRSLKKQGTEDSPSQVLETILVEGLAAYTSSIIIQGCFVINSTVTHRESTGCCSWASIDPRENTSPVVCREMNTECEGELGTIIPGTERQTPADRGQLTDTKGTSPCDCTGPFGAEAFEHQSSRPYPLPLFEKQKLLLHLNFSPSPFSFGFWPCALVNRAMRPTTATMDILLNGFENKP